MIFFSPSDENVPPVREDSSKPFRKPEDGKQPASQKENPAQAKKPAMGPKDEHLTGLQTHLSSLVASRPSDRTLIRLGIYNA